jgi:hypothetical protein
LTRPQRTCDAFHNGMVDYLPAQTLRETGRNLTPSASIFSRDGDGTHLIDGCNTIVHNLSLFFARFF